jgi:acyl-CoA thioester hydrolase
MADAHRFSVRVYYEDTDFSGAVYHAAYLKFCERARTEWLRERGVHHFELAREGLAFAVRHLAVDFLRAARIDDLLEVETEALAISGARLTLRQTLFRGPEVIAIAQLVIAAITREGRPTRLPKAVTAAFSAPLKLET